MTDSVTPLLAQNMHSAIIGRMPVSHPLYRNSHYIPLGIKKETKELEMRLLCSVGRIYFCSELCLITVNLQRKRNL